MIEEDFLNIEDWGNLRNLVSNVDYDLYQKKLNEFIQ